MERIRAWRERISAGESQAVRREVLSALTDLPKPERARAYGLVVACCRDLDETADGLRYLAEGVALGVRAAAARTELYAQGAALLIHVGDAERARCYVEQSLDIVEKELARPERSSKWSRDRRRWFKRAKARNLVLRGDLTFRFKDRPGSEALRDAFAAIEIAVGLGDEQAAGVTLLCQVLVYHGGYSEVIFALRLTTELDRYFVRTKQFSCSHPHRLFARWGRAIAFARLGMDERAERVMTKVADSFIRIGMMADARMALDTLLWMIGERSGEIGRARFVAAKYQEVITDLELPRVPAPAPVPDGSVRGW